MLPSVKKKIVYSDRYREEAFFIWYNSGCPPLTELSKMLPSERNTYPGYQTVVIWHREDGWDHRAKELDMEIQKKIQRETIDARVEMFKRHAEIGKEMLEKGIEYLNKNGLDDSKAAISAIKVGSQIEVNSRGIADALSKASKMSDEQLLKVIQGLVDGANIDDLDRSITDGKEETVLDGEFSDIEDAGTRTD